MFYLEKHAWPAPAARHVVYGSGRSQTSANYLMLRQSCVAEFIHTL